MDEFNPRPGTPERAEAASLQLHLRTTLRSGLEALALGQDPHLAALPLLRSYLHPLLGADVDASEELCDLLVDLWPMAAGSCSLGEIAREFEHALRAGFPLEAGRRAGETLRLASLEVLVQVAACAFYLGVLEARESALGSASQALLVQATGGELPVLDELAMLAQLRSLTWLDPDRPTPQDWVSPLAAAAEITGLDEVEIVAAGLLVALWLESRVLGPSE